jgi:hypothetical protein
MDPPLLDAVQALDQPLRPLSPLRLTVSVIGQYRVVRQAEIFLVVVVVQPGCLFLQTAVVLPGQVQPPRLCSQAVVRESGERALRENEHSARDCLLALFLLHF